ncbi:bifunctional PIG-L family deacetylase/class I SAM-dependent methyltransferase [Cellulomonas sp.]|uniref:bifunctional PIG-L family deacetylase/class I SAM-dependent methyltransferase n=1 Tax=Cellulomonas sp. TaxID=40001 RepID=UPI001B26226D|nr:bifunctional PIG-L family deacetylase/class I SAM-dependent methyltransferase [Cellulomonas sp.]MBO9553517.1 bifunctional PIG-L family deacetylase/class I SAM-dependent methyltransferase [Cellulomonas sp.]
MVTFDGRAPGTDPAVWTARFDDLHALALPTGRTVVVAAHPDDETLGAGGLIATLAARGLPPEVVVVSDGSGSHPGSPTLDPQALAVRRRAEVVAAVRTLSPQSPVTLLGHPDGGLREVRAEVLRDFRRVCAGPTPALLVAPWRGDGHRDHRVVGEVAAQVADALGCPLVEYPLWLWHWATPDDDRVPWDRLRALDLDPDAALRKRRAVDEHATQVRPLSGDPRDAATLHPRFLRGFDRDVEVLVVGAASESRDLGQDFFDGTYTRHDDPWGYTDRWYEARKRALTLAALPDERYGRAIEIGCSIGVLTADLAGRCDDLVALDVSPLAVARARERLADRPHVRVMTGDVARDMPDGPFDLVVLSEVGYYLTRPTLRGVLDGLRDRLSPGGTLLACHWRHPVAAYPLTGDDVHRNLARTRGLTRLAVHTEEDMVLEVYSPDPRSVARRTGLA